MRLTNAQAVARPVLPDRNPNTRFTTYAAGATAPHTSTVRSSYTVPAGKKSEIEQLYCRIYRDGAATTANVAGLQITYTPNGGGQSEILAALQNTNTIGLKDAMAIGKAGVMYVGDAIGLQSFDTSVGGTNSYSAVIKMTEGDA